MRGKSRSRTAVCVAVACTFVLLVVGPAGAADGDRGAGTNDGARPFQKVDDATLERLRALHYSESTEVRLVLLPTSVTDRRGRVVRGLSERNFRLYEDQILQEIRYFSSELREPVSLAFLLDVSGSMRQMDKLRHAKEAIAFLVGQLRPGDQFALICFADRQVAWVTEFTGDRNRFLTRLSVQTGYGQTGLHDAVAATPGLVDERIKGRKAIVLITDGIDNFSQIDEPEAIALARRVSVPIYSIGFLSVPEKMLPKETVREHLVNLRKISDETGGRLFAVHDPAELKEAVALLDTELRHQYLIGYYPAAGPADGQFHRIRLELDRPRLSARTRTGYLAQR